MKAVLISVLLSSFLSLNEANDPHDGHHYHHNNNLLDRELSAGRSCGFKDKDTKEHAEIDAAVSTHMARARTMSKTDEIIVDVYWHVLQNSNGDGECSDEVIDKSIQILNDAYGGVESSYPECSASGQSFTYESIPSSPFKFVLKGTTRVTNDGAHNLDSDESESYRENERVGDCSDLNIFTGSTNYLGFAYLPSSCPIGGSYQNPGKFDAVMLNYESLPEGGLAQYNQGDTATHEVGHWLGLSHTFDGGCSSNGDSVADTAPEESAANGCPVGRDTCSGGGEDPIHNFMDYSDDCCMYRFTPGQISRMVSQVRTFRGLEPTGASDDDKVATDDGSDDTGTNDEGSNDGGSDNDSTDDGSESDDKGSTDDGATNDDNTNDGSDSDDKGSTDDGVTNDESTNDGAADDDGATDDGATDDDDVTKDDDTTNDGATDDDGVTDDGATDDDGVTYVDDTANDGATDDDMVTDDGATDDDGITFDDDDYTYDGDDYTFDDDTQVDDDMLISDDKYTFDDDVWSFEDDTPADDFYTFDDDDDAQTSGDDSTFGW